MFEPILHIDDRLASLAEAATRVAARPGVVRRPHPKRISFSGSPDSALTEERALELAGSVVEALASVDVELLGEMLSPTVHVRTPTTDTHGFDQLAASSGTEAQAFTEIEVAIDTLIVTGFAVSAEWRLRALHTGPLHVGWAVIEATGQSIVLDGALCGNVAVIDAGGSDRCVFDDVHLHFDTTSLLIQLALT